MRLLLDNTIFLTLLLSLAKVSLPCLREQSQPNPNSDEPSDAPSVETTINDGQRSWSVPWEIDRLRRPCGCKSRRYSGRHLAGCGDATAWAVSLCDINNRIQCYTCDTCCRDVPWMISLASVVSCLKARNFYCEVARCLLAQGKPI